MNDIEFPIAYQDIITRIENIHPIQYAKTRNYLSGAVSYLSPYIARGIISLPLVANLVLKKFTRFEAEKFLQELAWREYFQRVWQAKGDAIFTDLKQPQVPVKHQQIPTALIEANTGIEGIDTAIEHLYETGYMHNHARMYTAMLTCNIAQAHWLAPAQWMYYHLLDGDLASNMLSWQWVAGAFSSKKYVANQENINRYTNTHQTETFLDCDYDNLPLEHIPEVLLSTTPVHLQTTLPESDTLTMAPEEKIFIYNAYNLDPLWHKDEKGTRILLLEPTIYARFPVSKKVIDFIVSIATTNIPDIKIIVADFKDIFQPSQKNNIYYKEHPLNTHYSGNEAPRDWLCASVTGYFPSFFNFWKKIQNKF